MTQKEYIKKLRFYLALRLPHAELSDIVSDMEELFAGAAADGKQGHYFTAMASISTRAPSGSAATATQLRAG